MATPNSRNVGIISDYHSRAAKPSNKCTVVTATQCRVGFPGGIEVRFDSEVNLHTAALKPASATPGQLRRFRDFHHAEQGNLHGKGALLKCEGGPARKKRNQVLLLFFFVRTACPDKPARIKVTGYYKMLARKTTPQRRPVRSELLDAAGQTRSTRHRCSRCSSCRYKPSPPATDQK
jgi:hypothetical protein